MGIRSLVSFGLLLVPIAITLGCLLGLDAYKRSSGQGPLFPPGSGGNTGGAGTSSKPVSINTYCQKAYGITPRTKGQQFTLNPNQWGWTEGNPGALCLNVTTFGNQTYATANSAPEWSVTWQYPQGPVSQPVHAFPNILYDGGASGHLPTAVSNLNNVNVDLHWTYGVGDVAVATSDEAALTAATLNSNVAIDMFLDSDQTKSQSPSSAKYEVMVWFAHFGTSTDPVGTAQSVTKTIDGHTFTLWYGPNQNNQYVLTWLADATTETFTGDIAPFITSLSSIPGIQAPAATDYLGWLQFGTEAFYSSQNVTFSVPTYSLELA